MVRRPFFECERGVKMFQQGQQIIYGGNGVCRIREIVLRETALSDEPVQVYVIQLASGLTSYVPVASTVFMRELISPAEAEAVIAEFPTLKPKCIASTNSKALADNYRAIIARHDPREMLCLYCSLEQKIETARNSGKKPGSMDERFSATVLAEICGEFSAVLQITSAEVLARLGISG